MPPFRFKKRGWSRRFKSIVTEDIRMLVNKPEMLIVAGPNGAGKTTLAKRFAIVVRDKCLFKLFLDLGGVTENE